jgi:tetratricopeptide (TPR) repeat protein
MQHIEVGQMIRRVARTVSDAPADGKPSYTLVLGSGFSRPVVPSASEMIREDIPWWMFYRREKLNFDFCQLSTALQKGAIDRTKYEEFARELWTKVRTDVVDRHRNDITFELGDDGFPISDDPFNVACAYTAILSGASDNGMYDLGERRSFVQAVVRRAQRQVNVAHIALAGILDWQSIERPFCRTIFTTNFDPLLQRSLQLVNVLYHVSDRPWNIADPQSAESFDTVHLVYTHGSVYQYDVLNTPEEIARAKERNAERLRGYFEGHGVIVLGYSGWDDAVMRALSDCRRFEHSLYWCDRPAASKAPRALRDNVQQLLEKPNAYYVSIPDGADDTMFRLHLELTQQPYPRFVVSPIEMMIDGLKNLVVTSSIRRSATEQVPENSGNLIERNLERLRWHQQQWMANKDVPSTGFFSIFSRRSPEEEKALMARLANDALIAYGKSDRPKAIELWSRVVKESRDEQEKRRALMSRAIAQRELKLFDKAIADYDEILKMNLTPLDEAEARTYRATALAYAERFAEAIAECDKVLQLNPDVIPPRLRGRSFGNRGWAKLSTGDLDGAIADSRQAVLVDPMLSSTRFNLGLALLLKGETAAAHTEYASAADEAPDAAYLHFYGVEDLEEARLRITDPAIATAAEEILRMFADRENALKQDAAP